MKTAVLVYDSFCNFEFSVAMEILALAERKVDIIAKTKNVVRSEEGLSVIADKTIYEIDLSDYDSLLLPGAMDIRETIEDADIIQFIRGFEGKVIGAISIAPLLLVKAGLLAGKPFMAGINKEEIMEEGYTEQDLCQMVDWNMNLKKPISDGYLVSDGILTSVSYNFVCFGLKFGEMLGIDIPKETFGL